MNFYQHRPLSISAEQYAHWLASLDCPQERTVMGTLGYEQCQHLPDLKRFVLASSDCSELDQWMQQQCNSEEYALYQLLHRSPLADRTK